MKNQSASTPPENAPDKLAPVHDLGIGTPAYLRPGQARGDVEHMDSESLRDPERALGFAKRASSLEKDSWSLLGTLALAQHRTGDTAAAVETQKSAIALMPEGADPELAQRLAEYEAALKDR